MVSRGRDTCSVKFVFLRCLSFSCKAGLAVSKVRDYQLIRIDGIAERENANLKRPLESSDWTVSRSSLCSHWLAIDC